MNECDDCGTMNRPSAAFCSGCGTDLGADAEFAAEEGFSVKWLVLGVLIMFGTNIGLGFLLGIVLAATGTKVSIVFTGLCGMVAFALGGYITGKQSPGKTILEPAVAALIAVVLSAILQGNANPLALVIGGALPFLAALGGAWLGERAQGTI